MKGLALISLPKATLPMMDPTLPKTAWIPNAVVLWCVRVRACVWVCIRMWSAMGNIKKKLLSVQYHNIRYYHNNEFMIITFGILFHAKFG